MIAPIEQTGGISALSDIEKRAKSYADLREQLSVILTELNTAIEALTRDKMPLIKKLVGRSAEKHAELNEAIAGAAHLFQKPRTIVFHGIKVGFRKNEGGIEFDDADSVVEKINKLMDCPENYLHVVEKPNKEALEKLSVSDLKRLGCRVIETGDVVVIKPTDSNVDKQVNALLKGALEEVE